MGIFDKLRGIRKNDQQVTPEKREPVQPEPSKPAPAPAPAVPSVEEKNTEAINTVLAAIDKAVSSLSLSQLAESTVEKYTGEFNDFRMQIGGIIPKADSTKIYETLKDLFTELPQALATMPEEKAKDSFALIRKSTTALSVASTDTDRERAVLQLRYVKTDYVISAMEGQIIRLTSEYSQTKEEMNALIPDDMSSMDKLTKFTIAQMKEKLGSIKNTIDAAEVSLDSLRVARQQAESALRRLELAPVGESIEGLVEQLREEVADVDAKLGSEVDVIRRANETTQEMFAEIKTSNEEVRRTLEETGSWKESYGQNVINEVLQERKAQQEAAEAAARQAAEAARQAAQQANAAVSDYSGGLMVDGE